MTRRSDSHLASAKRRSTASTLLKHVDHDRKHAARLPHSSGEVPVSLNATSSTRLPGVWLVMARAVWVTLAILAVALFVAGTLQAVGEPLPRCTQAGVECDPAELAAEDLEAIRDSGLPLGAVAVFFIWPDLMLNVTFLVVGVVIFWRRSDDWMALLFSITLVLLGMVVFTSSLNVLNRTHPALWWVGYALGYLAVTSLFL